jgi:hypothetical protein
MGGTFAAVADDASATWWNQAGPAGASYSDDLVEFGGVREPARRPGSDGRAC